MTLKTIGPLPQHWAELGASLTSSSGTRPFFPRSCVQDASVACLRADDRDEDGLGRQSDNSASAGRSTGVSYPGYQGLFAYCGAVIFGLLSAQLL